MIGSFFDVLRKDRKQPRGFRELFRIDVRLVLHLNSFRAQSAGWQSLLLHLQQQLALKRASFTSETENGRLELLPAIRWPVNPN